MVLVTDEAQQGRQHQTCEHPQRWTGNGRSEYNTLITTELKQVDEIVVPQQRHSGPVSLSRYTFDIKSATHSTNSGHACVLVRSQRSFQRRKPTRLRLRMAGSVTSP